ncbi:MAG: nicotinamide-nucleotide amidohydrolase family protein [Legionella sp.]|nr:nicotinamide-nucleotide amidohydrolase family protein [Legionella sp.]
MNDLKKVLMYLKEHELILTTAESCTAGHIIHLLAKLAGSGACLDTGYVVYCTNAKKRLLRVKQKTIDKYTLTSEPIAREMVQGALLDSDANVAVATTGIAGSKPMDGVAAGTICFGWGFKNQRDPNIVLYSETLHFAGKRSQILNDASKYALIQIPPLHQKYLTAFTD